MYFLSVVVQPTTADLPSSEASSVVSTSTSGTILRSSGEACLGHVTLYQSHHTAGSPPLRLLVEAVTDVIDWHTLGLKLNLTKSKLDGINITYHVHGVERLKTEMFDAWLKSSPNASWRDLISALKSMNEHRVASDIAARYSAGLTPGNAIHEVD